MRLARRAHADRTCRKMSLLFLVHYPRARAAVFALLHTILYFVYVYTNDVYWLVCRCIFAYVPYTGKRRTPAVCTRFNFCAYCTLADKPADTSGAARTGPDRTWVASGWHVRYVILCAAARHLHYDNRAVSLDTEKIARSNHIRWRYCTACTAAAGRRHRPSPTSFACFRIYVVK